MLHEGLPTSPPQRRLKRLGQVQTRLTTEQLAQLLERYRKGERAFQLAAAFGLHPKTVGAILKRAGVRRPRSMTEQEREEAIDLYTIGWSCSRIGKRLGRNHGTIWRALKVSGVKMRDEHGRYRL